VKRLQPCGDVADFLSGSFQAPITHGDMQRLVPAACSLASLQRATIRPGFMRIRSMLLPLTGLQPANSTLRAIAAQSRGFSAMAGIAGLSDIVITPAAAEVSGVVRVPAGRLE